MRFPIYESLYHFNRYMDEVLRVLKQIRDSAVIPKDRPDHYVVEALFHRSQGTKDILESLNDFELSEMTKLGKRKKFMMMASVT